MSYLIDSRSSRLVNSQWSIQLKQFVIYWSKSITTSTTLHRKMTTAFKMITSTLTIFNHRSLRIHLIKKHLLPENDEMPKAKIALKNHSQLIRLLIKSSYTQVNHRLSESWALWVSERTLNELISFCRSSSKKNLTHKDIDSELDSWLLVDFYLKGRHFFIEAFF